MLTHKGVILTIDGEVKITWVRDAMLQKIAVISKLLGLVSQNGALYSE